MDFTCKIYNQLLETFIAKGYAFITFETYCTMIKTEKSLPERFVILRHDVDLKAKNSYEIAKIEYSHKIPSTYYFRVVPQSNQPVFIRKIVEMGHEVGYHYEDMSLTGGDPQKAVEHFAQQLAYFRSYYPVKTVCMHGAPTSQYDSKDIWRFTNLKSYDLIGEPYYDTDFSKVFYLTDTGRQWDGYKVSVRDKIPQFQDLWTKQGLVYHRTNDIIKALQQDKFPKQVMITTHPQRWTDDAFENLKENILQKMKNVVKYCLIKIRKS